MKKVIIAGIIFIQAASPVLAQELPNRESRVREIVAQHSSLFGSEDGRREILGWLCGEMNGEDGGNWGLLVKNERNPPFIPADILVWKPTLEHMDVLTDSGPAWITHPRIEPSWAWVPCPRNSSSGSTPVVIPSVGNTPPPIFDQTNLIQYLQTIHNEVLIVKAEGRDTRAIAVQARDASIEADKEIKEHRDGVRTQYYKWAAIAGSSGTVIAMIMNFLSNRNEPATAP